MSRYLLTIASVDLLAFILLPLMAVAYALFATRRPRAIIRLTASELWIEQRPTIHLADTLWFSVGPTHQSGNFGSTSLNPASG